MATLWSAAFCSVAIWSGSVSGPGVVAGVGTLLLPPELLEEPDELLAGDDPPPHAATPATRSVAPATAPISETARLRPAGRGGTVPDWLGSSVSDSDTDDPFVSTRGLPRRAQRPLAPVAPGRIGARIPVDSPDPNGFDRRARFARER